MKGLFLTLMQKGQLGALILGVVSIAIILISIFTGLSGAGYEVGTDLNAILKDGGGDGFNFFNAGLYITAILIGIAFFCWIAFTLIQLISNPKDSLKMIIAFGVIIILFFVFMGMSDAETTGRIGMLSQKFDVSPGVSKFIGGGIMTTVVLALGAFFAMVIMEILNLFK